MSHNDRCAWLHGESCDCGPRGRDTNPIAAEADSLRRDLAVTRAALAQCATAMRVLRRFAANDGYLPMTIDECRALEMQVDALLVNPDIEHAVRVEAAREAVITHTHGLFTAMDYVLGRDWRKDTINVSGGDEVNAAWTKLADALDALTSERKS